MSIEPKQKRQYKKITPETIAKYKADVLVHGNGTRAIRETEPEYSAPDIRAVRIKAKASEVTAIDYIEDSLQQIGVRAIQRVDEMVLSENEAIATKNSHYVLDHIRGKAVQRSENKNLNITIEQLLA